MNPTDDITLKAFLAALVQLKEPLPAHVQTQLNKVGTTTPPNVGKLNAIAESYSPLDDLYQNAREIIQSPARERSKGPLPAKINDATEKLNTEIDNTVVAIEKIDSQRLTEIATKSFQASNSASSVKDALEVFVRSVQLFPL